jgi:hypothetical protein
MEMLVQYPVITTGDIRGLEEFELGVIQIVEVPPFGT